MIFDYLFLPVVFLIGIVTSYEDFKYGKVRNKWIVWGCAWGLGVICFLFLWYLIANPVTDLYRRYILKTESKISVWTVSPTYLRWILINFFVSFVIAFLIWRWGNWAAGDAKLFALYALLLPLKYYQNSYLPYFNSFVLLVNIFFLVFVYLFARSVAHFLTNRKKEKKEKKKFVLKQFLKNKYMILVMLNLFVFFEIFQIQMQSLIKIDVSSVRALFFAALIIFSGYLSRIVQKPIVIKSVGAFFVLILAYGAGIYGTGILNIVLNAAKTMAIFMIVMAVLRKMIQAYADGTSIAEIPIDQLSTKMNLPEELIERMRREEKDFPLPIYPDGLSDEQVEFVRRWAEAGDKKTIEVYSPYPFVPWMFAGVILTICLKGSLLHLLLSAFRS